MRWQYVNNTKLISTGNTYLAFTAALSLILNGFIYPWIPSDIHLVSLMVATFTQQFSACLFTFMVLACIIINLRVLRKASTVGPLLREFFLHRLLALVAVFLCMFNFSVFKQTIPAISPFSWDPVLLHIDMTLLGGQSLTTWLNTYLPAISLSHYADYCYAGWAAISGTILLWRVLCNQPYQRFHFLLSWLLCWILLGSIAALLFSSVGPCFYAYFYTDIPSTITQTYPLQLSGTLLTDTAKTFLLNNSKNHHYAIGMGISAFPSLHVATSVINAQTLSAQHAVLGWLGWLYVVAVSISATYLGFHYLIDCLVAIAAAYGIWLFTTYLLRDHENLNDH